jgi:hypothetical protein
MSLAVKSRHARLKALSFRSMPLDSIPVSIQLGWWANLATRLAAA